MTHEFRVRTTRKQQVVDITARVSDALRNHPHAHGLCHVFVPHATAAVVINESADPQIGDDLLEALGRLVPEGIWRHDRIDDNGAAHLKAAILGAGELVPLREGQLALGTWQALMLVELDGPRERRVVVTLLGGTKG